MKKNILLGVISLIFILTISLVSADLIPNTSPCWVKGTVTSSDVTLEGVTVEAYLGTTLLKSGTISSGIYGLNSIGANDGNTIDLKVYGHTFKSFTFAGFCKTGDDPWVIQDFSVSKQADGQACNNNIICSSGLCSNNVCTAVTTNDGGGSSGGSSSGGIIPITTSTNETEEETKDNSSEIIISSSNLKSGYENWMYENDTMQFNINNQQHILKLNFIKDGNVTITISSTPKTNTLSLNQEWKVDVDDDNVEDILVKIIALENNKAKISIKEITQEVVQTLESKEVIEQTSTEISNEEQTETKSRFWLWLLIILIIIVILFFVLINRNKNKHKHHYHKKF